MFGIDDAIVMGAASAAGGLLQRADARQSASMAQDFSANQFATRYQTTVKDLQAAGLSPTLAYSQGGGSPPTGVSYQAQNPFAGVASSYSSGATANAQRDKYEASADADRASADQSRVQADLIRSTTRKVDQELENLKTDNERVKSVVKNLGEEYQNLVKQGYNLTEVGNQIRATVDNLKASSTHFAALTRSAGFQAAINDAEATLRQFDVEATKGADNIGRRYAQYKPILDLLRSMTVK